MAGEVYELDDSTQFLKFIQKNGYCIFYCKPRLDNTPKTLVKFGCCKHASLFLKFLAVTKIRCKLTEFYEKHA